MMKLPDDIEALFENDQIRRSRMGDQTLYASVDLVRYLTERPDAEQFWDDLKRWEPGLASLGRKIELPAPDGGWQEVEMLNTEQALRLVQSINSERAERIKLWLVETARQHMEEAADPELAIRRTRLLYEQEGYHPNWISKRIRGISARQELVRQWARRGAAENDDYRTLTNELTSAAFDMDVQRYRRYKGIGAENLRDHMSELELALLTLAETTAAILHQDRDSLGVAELQQDVRDAGAIAGQTRQAVEQRLGKPAVRAANLARPLFQRRRRWRAAR